MSDEQSIVTREQLAEKFIRDIHSHRKNLPADPHYVDLLGVLTALDREGRSGWGLSLLGEDLYNKVNDAWEREKETIWQMCEEAAGLSQLRLTTYDVDDPDARDGLESNEARKARSLAAHAEAVLALRAIGPVLRLLWPLFDSAWGYAFTPDVANKVEKELGYAASSIRLSELFAAARRPDYFECYAKHLEALPPLDSIGQRLSRAITEKNGALRAYQRNHEICEISPREYERRRVRLQADVDRTTRRVEALERLLHAAKTDAEEHEVAQ